MNVKDEDKGVLHYRCHISQELRHRPGSIRKKKFAVSRLVLKVFKK